MPVRRGSASADTDDLLPAGGQRERQAVHQGPAVQRGDGALAVRDLYSDKRGLYKVQYKRETLLFKLGDATTGAMIAGLVDQATSRALKRDLAHGTKTGVTLTDFQDAINTVYNHHAELNPAFDLEEFCDLHGIDRKEASFSKIMAS